MAGNLADLISGLATSLGTIPNVTVSTDLVDKHDPPVLFVKADPDTLVEYHQAMRNGVEYWHLIIEGKAAGGSYPEAAAAFDAFAAASGNGSVKAAAEADQTLGGAASSVTVQDIVNYTEGSTPEGVTVMAAHWRVQIIA